jgi:hypothetical protein
MSRIGIRDERMFSWTIHHCHAGETSGLWPTQSVMKSKIAVPEMFVKLFENFLESQDIRLCEFYS